MLRLLPGGDFFWRLGGPFSIIIFLVSSCFAGSDEQKLSDLPTLKNGFIEVQEISTRKSSNPKLDSTLNQLLEIYHGDGIAEAQIFAKTRGSILEDELVQVVIVVNPMEVEKLTEIITNLGGGCKATMESGYKPWCQ